jgi:hypothetical protein
MKENALDLIAWLRANQIKPIWAVTNGWKGTYKNKALYYIRLYNRWKETPHLKEKYGRHTWVVTLYLEENMEKYAEQLCSEGLQDFVRRHVHHCMLCRTPCHGKTPPHKDVTVLGKEVKGICHGRPLTWVFDPDTEAVGVIKRLLALEQHARNEA